MTEKLTCEKCGRTITEKEFFKMKSGKRDTLCKTCLTRHIDNYDKETFLWILERYDVPYIEETWVQMVNKILAKQGPGKFGPSSVIGQYIRAMNMTQYKDFCYADTNKINAEAEQKRQEEIARRESIRKINEQNTTILQEKLEKGEISEAEYKTLNVANNEEEATTFIKPSLQFNSNVVSEEEILKNLNADDQLYLTTKWGAYYKPSEWIQMEQMFNRYANEYDLNIDREETLKKICKVSLKMDQAIDSGDLTASKNYNSILDTLRKSAKFTEAQNKEEVARELDSIGELIALCERDGGIIEQFPIDPDEYPQDKIDFTIKDLKSYNYNLVVNELGLGDLIESYIEKLEKREEEDTSDLNNMVMSAQEEMEQMLTDEEAIDFSNYLMDEFEKDAEALIREVGENESK